ncbi:MAG TPA: lipopolysaccharide biosynthesis protein [Clostridiaceae bacterium]|nr:lipopolysaccharide biosynthesis protein [Clostridiaceae bacterium]
MEEISLRELIETILKEKWMIAAITIVCMMASVIVTFFIMDPVYEAKTMLMISPITDSVSVDTEGNRFFNLVESLSKYPIMTIDTYKEQVKAPVILDYIRTEMGWNGKSLAEISNKITVSIINNTNLLNVSVRDTDPEVAAKVANLISERFSSFVSDTNRNQVENSARFIKSQVEKEKENLDRAMKELKTFLSQPRGPEELRQELESKLAQLTEFKTEVARIRIEEKAAASALATAKSILDTTPATIVTNKTLADDELLSDVIKDNSGLKTEEIAGLKLSNEEINEAYVEASKKVNEILVELATLSAQRINIENQIASLQKEIETLQTEYAEKQQEYEILNHEVELVRQTYNAYQQKYKEAMIKKSADVGETSIIVLSKAIPPVKPVEPKKTLYLAIATVLGLMIGVFAAFFKEYWTRSGAEQREKVSTAVYGKLTMNTR